MAEVPQTDQRHPVERYFSRGARRYHEYATFQRQIAENLAARFLAAVQPDSILELGCGTGFLTRELGDRFPRATIEAMDLSPEMIQVAREAMPSHPVRWQVADMNRWRASQPYELVASSTALHWADSLSMQFRRIQRYLVREGNLVAAIMAADTLTELRQLRLEVAPDKVPERRLPSARQLRVALAEAELELCQWEQVTCRQTFRSARDLFRTLRCSSFTGGPFAASSSRPLVRSELERLHRLYQQRHGDTQGNVHATFQVIYLRARRH